MKRDLPWAQSFIKKRGIEHISKILTSKSLHGKMKNEHYQTLTNLLEIFCHILKFFRL